MATSVQVFRGQGVLVEGRGYGTVHRFESPTELLIKFREGFETIAVNQLLPASDLESLVTIGHRYQESDLELDLSPRGREDELEPELSDEEPDEQREQEFQEGFAENTGD
jgi:hypothetical protein